MSRVDKEHKPFYEHIKSGGKVWRNDPLNNVTEVLDLSHERLKSCAENITLFGYSDLMIIPTEHEHLFTY